MVQTQTQVEIPVKQKISYYFCIVLQLARKSSYYSLLIYF